MSRLVALVLGIAAVSARGSVTMVSCRALPPATIQLIWRAIPRAAGYSVQLTRANGARIIEAVTTDTTWTQGSLPAGGIRIHVEPMFRAGAVPDVNGGAARSYGVTLPAEGGPAACR